MGFVAWMKSLISGRGKALSLYRSGMAKAKSRDYIGAITDYSAAIDAPDVPADVKAMATYNRGLAYSAMDEPQRAAEDLAAVLKMPGLPANVKFHAQERQERLRRRDERKAEDATRQKHE